MMMVTSLVIDGKDASSSGCEAFSYASLGEHFDADDIDSSFSFSFSSLSRLLSPYYGHPLILRLFFFPLLPFTLSTCCTCWTHVMPQSFWFVMHVPLVLIFYSHGIVVSFVVHNINRKMFFWVLLLYHTYKILRYQKVPQSIIPFRIVLFVPNNYERNKDGLKSFRAGELLRDSPGFPQTSVWHVQKWLLTQGEQLGDSLSNLNLRLVAEIRCLSRLVQWPQVAHNGCPMRSKKFTGPLEAQILLVLLVLQRGLLQCCNYNS